MDIHTRGDPLLRTHILDNKSRHDLPLADVKLSHIATPSKEPSVIAGTLDRRKKPALIPLVSTQAVGSTRDL